MLMLLCCCCCCLCFCCCWLSLFRCCCFPPFCLPPAYKSSLAASCAHFWTLSIAASSHAPHQWCPPCINIRFSHHQQSIPNIPLILRYHHCSLHTNTNALVEVTMISPKIMPSHICHICMLFCLFKDFMIRNSMKYCVFSFTMITLAVLLLIQLVIV